MSRNLKIIIILKLILWSIIIYSGITIFNWIKDNYYNNKITETINDKVFIKYINEDNNIIDVNTNNIDKMNNDIKGWIKVEGTNVNYPFVQTDNNNYYLYHSIDKSKNNAGWIFLDYRNNLKELNKNTIIYGHNRINNTMFGSLKKTMNNDWLNNSNHYINISTNNYNSLWEIFSIYHINKTNDYLTIDFNDEEFNNFIELINNRSIYNFNNKPNEKDYLITLTTCYNDNERFVIHGKLIKKEGKINEK